jgi:heat-inducible transcriptional repressor
MLSEREHEIMCEVVELYLAAGEPVASAALAQVSRTGLSAPSLRTTLAALERKGLLVQPHTSAGRIPSDLAFRGYIERLLQHTEIPAHEARRLRGMLQASGPLEETLADVSRILARVTAEVGVALAPTPRQASVQSMHFVRVAAERVLAVLVTSGGLIDSRLLSVEGDFQPAELERISNYCTENYAGLTLDEIRLRLFALMHEERARADSVLAGVVALGSRAIDTEVAVGGEVFVEGAANLLDKALPGQLEAMRQLLAAFADKALLLRLLNEFVAGAGPRVVLGSEFASVGGEDLGLIVTSFERDTGERGLVGVIGLKRMDYSRIIPIVGYLGQHLSQPGCGSGALA